MNKSDDDTKGHSISGVHSISDVEDINPSCVSIWMDKAKEGTLSPIHFKEFWRTWVPRIYNIQPDDDCLEFKFDDEKAQKILFDTLEEFIYDGKPNEVKKKNQFNSPSPICGYIFKDGDVSYHCRECAVDPTCVLCADCFKQSVHTTHKYRMSSSSGNGYCDCGDHEAWTSDPTCKIHQSGESKTALSNKIPAEVAARARSTFKAILKYCCDILSMDHSPGLPADLCVKESDDFEFLPSRDSYCTVLFNDESHSFDQVIITVLRVIKCSHRDSIEFVSKIDREGRAVIKCSGFEDCNDIKDEIERFTSRSSNNPLKVLVEHTFVVAHQIFAMKLLDWLREFFKNCKDFRIIFSSLVLLSEPGEVPFVESIILRDHTLWKNARTCWHRLFIAGMLPEYENKKSLAEVFVKNYISMAKNFIADDHDHNHSIVCLSVQIFTVGSIAYHLIAHHDALLKLFTTFNSESSRRLNPEGILNFDKIGLKNTFKRAYYILDDVKYLLTIVPDKWTMELRVGFLQGVSLLSGLLKSMQYMDSTVRQVGQHIEYEQEWESAFNLYLRLVPVIDKTVRWCSTDRGVLVRSLRVVLSELEKTKPKQDAPVVRTVADVSTKCIAYDVGNKPVSIHLPLSRFAAALFLHMEEHQLDLSCSELKIPVKPTPEELIEPALRSQTMIAQVQAGMWRRNGYSLIHQLFFYSSVQCRGTMLDLDIVLLQKGANLIGSDEFLIHVLNKYGLINWTKPEFEITLIYVSEEDTVRQTITLIEEFLGLIINLIGERYLPGVGCVTTDDCLKHELIHQLCIKSKSHSELIKSLNFNPYQDMALEVERVIQDVAKFKKPGNTSTGKGMYVLKSKFYSEYNTFFYHYTKECVNKAEQAQRKRRKNAGELECCPPPKLPKLTNQFFLLNNLLQCDVMMYVMQTILTRALDLKTACFSETQIHKVLHLIGYALQEQASKLYPYLAFTEKAVKWNIYNLLESLKDSPRIDAHKDLLKWVLLKYREVSGMSIPEDEQPIAEEATPEDKTEDDENSKKESSVSRAEMIAKKRAQVMAEMKAMQNHFLEKNQKLFTAPAEDVNSKGAMDQSLAMDMFESIDESPIALGNQQTTRGCFDKSYRCILCREDEDVLSYNAQDACIVMVAFVQQSTVHSQREPQQRSTPEATPLFLTPYLGPAPYTSTCGHVMHGKCWKQFFESVRAKENRRPYRLRQPATFDVENFEYLCPLCEGLCNTILPVLPSLGSMQPTVALQPDLKFDKWLDMMTSVCKCKGTESNKNMKSAEHDANCRYCKPRKEPDADEENSSAPRTKSSFTSCPIEAVESHGRDGQLLLSLYSVRGPQIATHIVDSIRLYTLVTFTKGLECNCESGDDSRIPLLCWKSTAYTFHAIEIVLRSKEKPLLGSLSSKQRVTLESLARVSAVMAAVTAESKVVFSSSSVADHAFTLLSCFLNDSESNFSILSWDPFGMLISLLNSLSNLLSTRNDIPRSVVTGNIAELYVTRLVFMALIVKILLTSNFDEDETMDMDDDGAGNKGIESTSDSSTLLKLMMALNVSTGKLSAMEIWKRVKDSCASFLRCCVLYFHYVTDVPAPAELAEKGGDTFENMCRYLGLPETCEGIFESDKIIKLAVEWSHHPGMTDKDKVPKEPPRINRLVELPEDYSELIDKCTMVTCPNNNKVVLKNPTLCLICGTVLCSQSYCCQAELNKIVVGACTHHTSKCGAGVGMFLRIRECEMFYLRSPIRGSHMVPPYFDEYGEADRGLRRGSPLKLCKNKYNSLVQIWLEHELYEVIARANDTPVAILAQWQHM